MDGCIDWRWERVFFLFRYSAGFVWTLRSTGDRLGYNCRKFASGDKGG